MLCVNLMCSLNAMHTLPILRQNVNGSLSVVVQSMSVKVKQELLFDQHIHIRVTSLAYTTDIKIPNNSYHLSIQG